MSINYGKNNNNTMSTWDQNFGYDASGGQQQQQQGFYNPSAPGNDVPSFYGNYGTGSDPSSYAPNTMNFMTPAPLGGSGPYDSNTDGTYTDDEFANEPPLLEELGINPEHIFQKTLSVLNPFRATRPDVAGDSDLAGPLVISFI